MQTKVSIRRKKDMSVSVSPSLVLKRVPVDLKRVHPSNKENSLILKNKTNNNNSNNNEKQQQQKNNNNPTQRLVRIQLNGWQLFVSEMPAMASLSVVSASSGIISW